MQVESIARYSLVQLNITQSSKCCGKKVMLFPCYDILGEKVKNRLSNIIA